MTEAAEHLREVEVAPAAEPANTPAPSAKAADFDGLLAEYDAATKGSRASEPAAETKSPAIDRVLRELVDGPDPRIAELQGQVDKAQASITSARERYEREIDQAEFEKFAKGIQAELPDHVPDDYARSALMQAAMENPALRIAWDCRRLNIDERAARAELAQGDALLRHLMTTDADPNQIAAQREYCGQLQVATQWQSTLRQAERDVIARAKKALPPIDEQITFDHNAVAAAVRGNSQSTMPPEPQPDLSRLSDNELRAFTFKNYGF